MENMLILPIKKKWFDMVRSGEKLDEYREHKEYWGKRFAKIFGFNSMEELDRHIKGIESIGRHFSFEVMYRNGYSGNSPSFVARVKLTIGTGKEEWGAEPGKEYYVLRILEVRDGKSV